MPVIDVLSFVIVAQSESIGAMRLVVLMCLVSFGMWLSGRVSGHGISGSVGCGFVRQ